MSDPIFDEYQLRKFEDYKILERGKRMSKKEPIVIEVKISEQEEAAILKKIQSRALSIGVWS